MYEQYWGLEFSPFLNNFDVNQFFESSTHEEAVARLFYLVEQHRRFGVVTGLAGTGKSLLLQVLADQVSRTQRRLVAVDLCGADGQEMLWQMASEMNLVPQPSDTPRILWQALDDHLSALSAAGIQTVFLIDHLDRADAACLPLLQRICMLSRGSRCWTTMIAAVRTIGENSQGRTLEELSDLSVDVGPLTREETAAYVTRQCRLARCERRIFDMTALARVFELTGGIPRDINRLCDLALLAGLGEGTSRIHRGIIDSVAGEATARFRRYSAA